MNPVLDQILRTRTVTDGAQEFPLHSAMDAAECSLITAALAATKPDVSIEIGLAYGVSALYACDALAENRKAVTHIVIDPFQTSQWHGIGIKNIVRAGYGNMVRLVEEKSEIALPNLLSQGTRVQAGIIDGWHTFDHALIDFFYINKMLDVGGIVIFDDADWPSLMPLMRHISTYPAYRRFMPPPVSARTRIRRALAKQTRLSMFSRRWDYPSCVAFQKIAADERNWDWHESF